MKSEIIDFYTMGRFAINNIYESVHSILKFDWVQLVLFLCIYKEHDTVDAIFYFFEYF